MTSDVLGPRSPGSRPRIIVVGAINLDLVVDTDRLPGPGETVVGGSLRRYGGGKGANAAVAAARAGAHVLLIGAVGADDNGRNALNELIAEGVDITNVATIADEASGVALIVVSRDGENQIAVAAGANMRLTADHMRVTLRRLLPTADCVLVSTEIAADALTVAVEMATDAGVPCVLNPAPVVPAVVDLLHCGPILTPNSTELEDLRRELDSCADAEARSAQRAARTVADRTGAAVVVTLGSAGSLVLEPGEPSAEIPANPATVRDTTGAGDTFNGVLAFRIGAGDTLRQAVGLATAAASLSVESVGARTGMPYSSAIQAG